LADLRRDVSRPARGGRGRKTSVRRQWPNRGCGGFRGCPPAHRRPRRAGGGAMARSGSGRHRDVLRVC